MLESCVRHVRLNTVLKNTATRTYREALGMQLVHFTIHPFSTIILVPSKNSFQVPDCNK